MSISGILSSFSQNPTQGAAPLYQQQLQQLSKDLQSGNLASAQSDFATLQKAFSGSATPAATGSASASQAFNQLVSDLQSGNLSAAQKDISTVQQALQSAGGTTRGNHPHHHPHGGGDEDLTNQNSLLQDLNQASQSLTSANSSSAQQSYASLQQQLQQFSLGGGALSTQSPFSFDA